MSTVSGHTSAIRARKVFGTAVTDTAGRKIGEIEDIVLDKESSNIMFAVVSFGGFLGMGDKYHPPALEHAGLRSRSPQLCRERHQGAAAVCAR